MKVSQTIRNRYSTHKQICEALRKKVDADLRPRIEPKWHYASRTKELESYAQKIETGRGVDGNGWLEDLFGCLIVVENRASISRADGLVRSMFTVVQQRPMRVGETHKTPECFPFDDLRLYVKLKSADVNRESEFGGKVFEVQIKTFFQHAWVIATHDLVYKSASVDWGLARVAWQVKAMLEQAEVAIDKASELAKSSTIRLTDPQTRDLLRILKWLDETWGESGLPKDKLRLARTIRDLARRMSLEIDELIDAVRCESSSGRGSSSVNLSPYGVVVQSLVIHQQEKVRQLLTEESGGRAKLVITPEIEMGDDLREAMKSSDSILLL